MASGRLFGVESGAISAPQKHGMQQREFYEVQAGPETARPSDSSPIPDARDRGLASWLAQHVLRRRALLDAQARPLNIVELGCGDGSLSIALASLPQVQVLGVDIAKARIARAAAAAARLTAVSFRVLDLDGELDALETGSADVVVSVDVLEHVFDVFSFVGQIARIVRPQGLVLLRVPNLAYIRHRLALAHGDLPITSSWFGPKNDLTAWRTKWGWDGGHLHNFTLPTLRALLTEFGLKPLDWRDPGARFSPIRRLAPSLLAGNLAVLAERTLR